MKKLIYLLGLVILVYGCATLTETQMKNRGSVETKIVSVSPGVKIGIDNQYVGDTLLKKEGLMNFNCDITLWPIIAIIVLIVWRKNISNILCQISELSFGDLSIKLRRSLKIPKEEYEKIKSLTSNDVKFFFAVASQSWEIDKVTWKLNIEENLTMHKKLESAGLVSIKNKTTAIQDNKVDSQLTSLGEEFYLQLTLLISDSIL